MKVRTAAMFPLGTVLFPHALLSLHVFEPRYRAMTRDVLDGDQEFGVVLIERGSEVGGGDVRFDVGTMAHIVQASELPDGRFALAVVGVQRFRVDRWLPDAPYPRAEIVELAEPRVGADVASTVDAVAALLRDVHELNGRLQGVAAAAPPVRISPDPEQASFEMAALAPLGPLDAQRLLELPDTAARLRALHEHLSDDLAVLRARTEPPDE
ncbi:MAG: ATP-dependent Lon protease [Actinomycetota bacterium]|jgi:Lon protease-like protein|nr:ATP-dependent Lon protease [Actinomycetota bacterium]